GTPESREVVDVRRAEIDLHRVEEVGQQDALGLCAGPVDVHLELWNVGLESGEGHPESRRALNGSLQIVERAREGAHSVVRAILEIERVARPGPEAEDRRGHESKRDSFLDGAELAVELCDDLFRAALALAGVLERDEH